jgi:hypothetical protein
MAIVFGDTELRTASSELVGLPAKLANMGNQQAQVDSGKVDAYNKDLTNKVFYDDIKGIIASYFAELQNLDGTIKTVYNDTDMDEAAQQHPGAHFPNTPIWKNLVPKLLDANNGNPTTSTPNNEYASLAAVATAIDVLKNGFNDGSLSTTLATAYTAGSGIIDIYSGSLSPGQRVVIDSGGHSLIALVGASGGDCSNPLYTDEAACLLHGGTWTPTTSITILSADRSFGSGARVRTWHPGFTNNEREGVDTPYAPEVRDYFGSLLDTNVALWKSYLQAELSALNANDARSPDKAEINQTKIDVQVPLTNIANYQAAPALGAGVGRLGNSIINVMSPNISTRTTQIPARVTQINTRLGSVSQASDGTFSGTGQFYTFFKWVDARCDKAGGTLNAYYGYDLTKKAVDKTKDLGQNKQDQYTQVLLAVKLTQDANGTDTVVISDASGFSVTDVVYLHDDNTALATVSTTILAISGNNIQLATTISGFTTNKTARIVKYL